MTTDTLPVSERAREAVQAFHREMGDRLLADIKNGTDTLSAKGDDSDPIYQAFARFERETADRVAMLESALATAREAVQAFLDMANVIDRVQALPIPAIIETAQHNCPIILEQIDAALKGTDDGAE